MHTSTLQKERVKYDEMHVVHEGMYYAGLSNIYEICGTTSMTSMKYLSLMDDIRISRQ